MAEPPPAGRLRELLVVFGTLGVIGFGGRAAHIALMRREVVERRGWLTDQQLVDLAGGLIGLVAFRGGV